MVESKDEEKYDFEGFHLDEKTDIFAGLYVKLSPQINPQLINSLWLSQNNKYKIQKVSFNNRGGVQDRRIYIVNDEGDLEDYDSSLFVLTNPNEIDTPNSQRINTLWTRFAHLNNLENLALKFTPQKKLKSDITYEKLASLGQLPFLVYYSPQNPDHLELSYRKNKDLNSASLELKTFLYNILKENDLNANEYFNFFRNENELHISINHKLKHLPIDYYKISKIFENFKRDILNLSKSKSRRLKK